MFYFTLYFDLCHGLSSEQDFTTSRPMASKDITDSGLPIKRAIWKGLTIAQIPQVTKDAALVI